MIFLKSEKDIACMKPACELTARILRQLGEKVNPGTTTMEINDYAGELCKEAGARPLFLNYPGSHSGQPEFPGIICASPNEVVVHGVPNGTPLKEGDIFSADFGCQLKGFCGDSAFTYAVGQISEEAQKLLDVTREALRRGIEQAVVGNRIGDISWAIQSYVESEGCGIVRTLVGHGIGRSELFDTNSGFAVVTYADFHRTGFDRKIGMTHSGQGAGPETHTNGPAGIDCLLRGRLHFRQ